MTILGRREKRLDGQEIMELWVQLDSLGRVNRYFQTLGRVNPRTGHPFSDVALWRAAAAWMVDHKDDARLLYEKAEAVFSDSEWEQLIIRRALQLFKGSRSGFLKWVIRHEWPKKYEHLYRDAYNVTEEDYNYFAQTARRIPTGAGRKRKNSTPVSA